MNRASNLALARLFEEIAYSLYAAGEQGHRPRAYRRAARAIAAHPESLEVLAAEGRLREVPAVGPSLSALIDEFLDTGALRMHARLVAEHPPVRRRVRDLRLKSAWEVARQVLGLLVESAAPPDRIEVAGAARRMCEVVPGGIELVAAPGRGGPHSLLDAFVDLPGVAEVLDRSSSTAHVGLWDGAEVTLHVTSRQAFGTTLVQRTGSAAHLARLGHLPTAAEEETLYRLLDLPWIAPELREDAGEIEAAREGALPRLLEQADLYGDLHCHTHWTDGSASLEDMARAARSRGYAYMALTDHSRSLVITNGLSLERLEEARRQVNQLNHALAPFVILLGTEMDVLEDGRLDYPDEVLATLDYVSASIHRRFKQPEEVMTPRILRAVTHPLVHTLNHPHGRLLGARRGYAVDMPRVIEAAAEAGCALEVSGDPARMDLDGGWARRAKAAGARCTVSSDAHSTLDYDNIWLGVGSARRGWLEPGDVLNARPLPELRALLRKTTDARLRCQTPRPSTVSDG